MSNKRIGCENFGKFYTEGKVRNRREWRGVTDTLYDYSRWLHNWITMAKMVSKPRNIKAMFRYRWMANYLAVPHMVDKFTMGLRDEALVVAAKVVALAVLSIAGSSATGLFLYVMASIIYGLYKRMGSLLVMLLVPIMIFGAPLIFMLAPRNGFVGAPLTVAFLVSVLFDVQNLRDRIRTYQAAKVGL